ncbi:putative aminotransferase class V [Heterobasidion irregulare TC 32-1]|uniref:alanine--glyoxylate transaminase n=1 Tax=Heterobasidion irregulare (strain TC 32-1) TaxID=747525 RepID=W4K040_HETIT|nr:putative aminotransferase class V [Heterobasidion irregulare TC 32-1]ETW79094.1 putative aminotransferase class V [Heterobasidion irregulare TC 32-1]
MSAQSFHQAPHKLLLIPGPVEVTDEVLFANAHPSVSHMSAEFVSAFGDSLRMTREVVYSKDAQPFLISGSGTLGWDQVSSNLVEAGENALVLNTGYFGESFADCLRTYGANVDQIKAELGTTVSLKEVEKALQAKKYKIVTITHVDTSTAVLSNPKAVAEVVRRVSPDTLVILDAVCAVASEEIRMDDWSIDVVVSASQKGLGAPPGLSVVVASQKALQVAAARSTPVSSYYASWKRWLPIMTAYEKGSAAYFATPPVNLIFAFNQSLTQIVKGSSSLEERFKLHADASNRLKAAAKELGLKQLAADPSIAANGMTALWCPPGVKSSELLPLFLKKGVVIAGGLGAEKDNYFRIGHMGTTVANAERGDVERIIAVLKEVIAEATSKSA